VFLRVRATRALGSRPGIVERHPFLVGLTASALVTFLRRRQPTAAKTAADATPQEDSEARESDQSLG
jgi:hypothetical protein